MASGAPVSAPLTNLSYWNSGFVSPDEANGAGGQAFLAALRKYDPNAAFVSAGLNSTEGGGNNYLALNFDPSKLPGMSGSGQLSSGPSAAPGQIGRTFAPNFSSVVNPDQVKSAGDIVNSPTYGNVALNTNFKPQNNGMFDLLALLPLGLGVAGMAGLLPTFGATGADAAAGAAGSGAAGAAGLGGYVGPDVSGALPAADLSTFGATTPTVGAGADAIGAAGAGAAAPIIDESTQAPLWESVAARLGIPVGNSALSTLGSAASLFGHALQAGNAVSGLFGGSPLTGPGGAGAGGGGGAINLGGSRQVADAGSLLRAFYAPRVKGSGQGNEALDPNNPMSLLPLRMMGLLS